jgi:hypothetical protein
MPHYWSDDALTVHWSLTDDERITTALTKLANDTCALESGSASLVPWRAELGRFEELYSAHSRSELAFLRDVATALTTDSDAVVELQRLLATI